MTKNFSWAVGFVLRLQSINLLVGITRPPQLVKNPDILGVEKWSANSLRHNTIIDFLKKKSLLEGNKTEKLKKVSYLRRRILASF